MKIHIGLVHNFGPRFDGAVALHHEVVWQFRSMGWDVSSSMQGSQPSVAIPGLFRSAKQKLANARLKDLYVSQVLRRRDQGLALNKQAAKIWTSTRSSERKKMWVDGQVTRKHSMIWDDALANKADYALVLEDDVRPKDDWRNRIDLLVKDIVEFEPQYVDLAGGFKTEAVTSQDLVLSARRSGIAFRGCMTNTIAGYIMDQSVFCGSLEAVKSMNDSSLIASDTLVNYALAIRETRQSDVCLHTQPSIFTHGSMSGEFKSWR